MERERERERERGDLVRSCLISRKQKKTPQKDQQTDRQTDRPMDGRMDQWTDGWTDQQMDKASYRDARMHQEIKLHFVHFIHFFKIRPDTRLPKCMRVGRAVIKKAHQIFWQEQ